MTENRLITGWQRQEMKGFGKKIAIPVALVLLGGILLWISGSPARNAKQIVPGMSFETVLKLLGEPENREETDGMNLCYFKPNFAAAGQIKVGFDNQKKAVYLKIWEDVPPQWDLRKGASSSQPAAPPDRR